MAVLASSLADHLRRKNVFTITQIRKIFTTFATMMPGLLMILQVFYGYNHTWSVVIFTFQLFLNGAVTAGYLGNGLDIAPNFSGTIFGLANTLSSISGYISSLMVGALTAEKVCQYFYQEKDNDLGFPIETFSLSCWGSLKKYLRVALMGKTRSTSLFLNVIKAKTSMLIR